MSQTQNKRKKFLTVSEAADVIGVSRATIKRRCASGDIKAKKEGKQWIIDKEECLRKALEESSSPKTRRGRKRKEDKEEENIQRQEPTPTVDINLPAFCESKEIETREELAKLNKYKAEELLKREQAWEKRINNLLREKKIISLEDFVDDLREIFASTWEEQREVIDKISIRFNLEPEITNEIHHKFNRAMVKALNRIKRKTGASVTLGHLREEHRNTKI